jgi:hypothetical protein
MNTMGQHAGVFGALVAGGSTPCRDTRHGMIRFLVALPSPGDLLLRAKHLLVEAMVTGRGRTMRPRERANTKGVGGGGRKTRIGQGPDPRRLSPDAGFFSQPRSAASASSIAASGSG